MQYWKRMMTRLEPQPQENRLHLKTNGSQSVHCTGKAQPTEP